MLDESAFFSLRLSLQVAVVATFLVVLVGTGFAYLLARKEFPGKELLDILLTLPLVLPPTVTGYYLVIAFGRNGFIGRYLHEWLDYSIMFTWHAAVLASFVVALPLMIKAGRAAIESVDKNMITAAYALGHSEFSAALHVTLPLARRGLLAGAVLSFTRALGEFGATLMLAGNIPGKTDTMPLAIYSLAGSGDWHQATGMVALLTLMAGTFLIIANIYSRKSR